VRPAQSMIDGDDRFEGAAELAGCFRAHAVNLTEALEPILRALYRGVDAHEQGSKPWSRHLDQSI